MKKCTYRSIYSKECPNNSVADSDFCEQHQHIKCQDYTLTADGYIKCNNKAIYECNDYSGSWPCGRPLCEDHLKTHHH